MKRLLGIVIALFVVLALVAVFTARWTEAIVVGRALPPGKVPPLISTAGDRAYLLSPDGSLWAWGGTQNGSADIQLPGRSEIPRQIGTNCDWIKFVAGMNHVLAIKNDHSLWSWGYNIWGELGVAARGSNAVPLRIGLENDWQAVTAGNHHSLALKTNGSLWAWGLNREGQVGDPARTNWFAPQEILPGSRWRAISAGGFSSYALRDDGTIWRWGFSALAGNTKNDFKPRQIGDGTNWIAISAGDFHLVALNRDGSIWAHGPNAHMVAPHLAGSVSGFAQLGSDCDWREVYSGANYVTLRKADGSWWLSGRLGKMQYDTPRRIEWAIDPWAFSSGGNTTILLAKDGGLWTWGDRLGSKEPRSFTKEAIFWLQQLLSRRRGRSSMPRNPIVDNEPHKVWSMLEQTNQTSVVKGP